MALDLNDLILGFRELARKLADPRDLLLDFRRSKSQSQQAYYSAIQGIPFSPSSIGRFDPRRGAVITPSTRFGFATGQTRRAAVGSFAISSQGRGRTELLMNTDAPSYARFFDKLLIERGIPEFTGGLITFTSEDERILDGLAGDFVERTAEQSIPKS